MNMKSCTRRNVDFDVLLLCVCVCCHTSRGLPKIPEIKLKRCTFIVFHLGIITTCCRAVPVTHRKSIRLRSLPRYVYWVVRLRFRTYIIACLYITYIYASLSDYYVVAVLKKFVRVINLYVPTNVVTVSIMPHGGSDASHLYESNEKRRGKYAVRYSWRL